MHFYLFCFSYLKHCVSYLKKEAQGVYRLKRREQSSQNTSSVIGLKYTCRTFSLAYFLSHSQE